MRVWADTCLKAHVFISNLTSSRLKFTSKESILMAEISAIHAGYIEEVIFNIKNFIICLIHRVGALLSDIVTVFFQMANHRDYKIMIFQVSSIQKTSFK